MLLLILLLLFLPIENNLPSYFLLNSVEFISVEHDKISEKKRNEQMQYQIMRLFPPIYDQIFEGKGYDGENYWSMPCLPSRSYFNPEKQDEFKDAAFDYYNDLFNGRNIAEIANIFAQEKNEIEKDKFQAIFLTMNFGKRKEGSYKISYQVPMEDPMSKICIMVISHEIYFHVDEETGVIENIGVARNLLGP